MEWSIPEAGSIWADCLLRHLGVPSTDREKGEASNTEITPDHPCRGDMLAEETGGVVLVTIGGGHYVPKVNDVVIKSLLFLLTSYISLPPYYWHRDPNSLLALCSHLPYVTLLRSPISGVLLLMRSETSITVIFPFVPQPCPTLPYL